MLFFIDVDEKQACTCRLLRLEIHVYMVAIIIIDPRLDHVGIYCASTHFIFARDTEVK